MGQTKFVKSTGKNQPVRVFTVVAVYFQNHTLYTHTTINQKFIQQTPIFFFQQLALFTTKNSSLWETDFASVTWSSNPSVIGKIQDLPSSFPFLFWLSEALKASDLWPTALLPSNSHLGKIQNNLR